LVVNQGLYTGFLSVDFTAERFEATLIPVLLALAPVPLQAIQAAKGGRFHFIQLNLGRGLALVETQDGKPTPRVHGAVVLGLGLSYEHGVPEE
jgi:hypothetical protein